VKLGVILPVLLGAALGYGYYALVGCSSGGCPITSNPWISTGYGALVGALFVRSKPASDEPSEEDEHGVLR